MNTLTIGADPEIFVARGGQLISGHTFPCGTKERPKILKYGAVQNDGMALEFNVRPSKTKVSFINNVVRVYKELEELVRNTDPAASLVVQPTAVFGKEYIDSMPDDVKELGCNPDFNAYDLMPNPKPNGNVDFRTGAGHVHIGFTRGVDPQDLEHATKCASFVKQLDYYLGLPSLSWDKDSQRRLMYGKAGCFRPKSYGMEYRTLSNAWLTDNKLMGFVYDRTVMAHKAWLKGNLVDDYHPGMAREIIDNNVTDWAAKCPEIAHFDYEV